MLPLCHVNAISKLISFRKKLYSELEERLVLWIWKWCSWLALVKKRKDKGKCNSFF